MLVTSHSADLLDGTVLGTDSLVAVDAEGGATRMASPDEEGRAALRSRLSTAGELLRRGDLRPDPEAFNDASGQLRLFDEEEL